jgi:hypothetical protein
MFIVPIVVFVALAFPIGMVSMRLTNDLAIRADITVGGTIVAFAVLVLAWRWVLARRTNPAEDSRLAWMQQPQLPAAAGTAAGDADPGAVDAWRVLNAAAEPRPEQAEQ